MNPSIIKSPMLGSHQSPFVFAWLNVTDSIILELWKIRSCLLKSRGAEDCLKTIMRLKLFEKKKLDFWNLFEKLEFRRLFKNWNFKVYLKIRFLETKCENENFRKWIWTRLEIWKMIWEFGILNKWISGWVNK